MTTTRTAALLLLVASTTGCSFVAVNGPPPAGLREAYVERGIVPCTKSFGLPVLDGVFGFLLVGTAVVSAPDDVSSEVPFEGAGAGVVLLFGVSQLLSSVIGYERVRRCNEFLETVEVPDTLNRQRVWNASSELVLPKAVPDLPKPEPHRHPTPRQDSPFGSRPRAR